LGFATDLDRIAFTGAPGEESFAIRSDVGTHTNEEGRSSALIEFLNRQTIGPPRRRPLWRTTCTLRFSCVAKPKKKYWVATTLLLRRILSFQYRRMINEEAILNLAFPEYRAHAARTPRMIPALPAGFYSMPNSDIGDSEAR